MAVRSWVVRPDHQVPTIIQTEHGPVEGQPVAAVSQEALVKAVYDGAILLDRAGGTLTVAIHRAETGVSGERVTAAAMVTWKDRTDAREAPEAAAPVLEPSAEPVTQVGRTGMMGAIENGHPVSVSSSGEEVDESDVPPELRGI